MSHLFHPSILREYDVRGIVGDTLSEADARALGKSYAALAISEGASALPSAAMAGSIPPRLKPR